MGTDQDSSIAVSAELDVKVPTLPDFDAVSNSSAAHWREYWSTGGMIDLSGAFALDDSRPVELERRVILSLYLHGAQEAGFVFTSESGLIQNSWSGKFHMVRCCFRYSRTHARTSMILGKTAWVLAVVCTTTPETITILCC